MTDTVFRSVAADSEEDDVQLSRHEVDGSFLTAAEVRKRYGNISEMTLWRWLNNTALNFPKPIVINRRRFFARARLKCWERERVNAGHSS